MLTYLRSKTSSVKDQCVVPTKTSYRRTQPLIFPSSSVTWRANFVPVAANSWITRQLEAQESTRVVTANSPSLSLSLSPRFSRSPPLFLFRFRNYSGVIAFRPPQYWLTRTRAKKKIPTVRVTHTHTRARARARSHETRRRETAVQGIG